VMVCGRAHAEKPAGFRETGKTLRRLKGAKTNMALSRDEILEEIDTTTMPELMTRPEALTWLEGLVVALESRCDELRKEIANESRRR
jgi:hypothetical protein